MDEKSARYIIENKSKSKVQWWKEGRENKNERQKLINKLLATLNSWNFLSDKKGISSRIKKGSAKNRRKFQTKFNTPSCAWETQKKD